MTNTIFAILLSAALSGLPHTSLAARWKVDQDSSKIGIIANINGAAVTGEFSRFSAEIEFDPEDLSAARITADIDLTAVKMPDPLQTATLGNKEWFNTQQFPTATFTSTRVKATGTNVYEISATLTLKDKTVPVKLTFAFTTANNKARALGELVIMRNDFNVGQGQFSSGAIVGLEVKLIVDISAELTDAL